MFANTGLRSGACARPHVRAPSLPRAAADAVQPQRELHLQPLVGAVPARAEESFDPASHYDRVTPAWADLLGDELHYGIFRTGTESLSEATAALIRA